MVRTRALIPAAVADSPANRVDPAGQRRLRDDSSLPDIVEQIVLADDPVAIFHEILQQIEHLGFNRHPLAATAQLLSADVKYMI